MKKGIEFCKKYEGNTKLTKLREGREGKVQEQETNKQKPNGGNKRSGSRKLTNHRRREVRIGGKVINKPGGRKDGWNRK